MFASKVLAAERLQREMSRFQELERYELIFILFTLKSLDFELNVSFFFQGPKNSEFHLTSKTSSTPSICMLYLPRGQNSLALDIIKKTCNRVIIFENVGINLLSKHFKANRRGEFS